MRRTRPEREPYRGCTIVEKPSGRLALRFRWTPPDGRQRRFSVTTKYKATQANRRLLLDKSAEIGAQIRQGVFDPRAHFDIKAPFGLEARSILQAPGTGAGKLFDRMRSWIEEKKLRRVRTSRIRDYRSHLANYIEVAPIGQLDPSALGFEDFRAFQLWLVSRAGEKAKGISEKTAANIIRGTLRAFLRDAGLQLGDLDRLSWERYAPKRKQDPFSAEERDKLLKWFRLKRPFEEYLSLRLRFLGVTPSEARGFHVGDFDRQTGTLTVARSHHLGAEGATKTQARQRVVWLEDVAADVAARCGVRQPDELLVDVAEDTLRDNFTKAQIALGIRHRSLYQAKHTYATLALLDEGESPAIVGRNLGISLATLEKHYAAALQKGRVSHREKKAVSR